MAEYLEFEHGKKFAGGGKGNISPSPDGYRDCGLILADSDYVVDIDTVDKKTIEALIDKFSINTQTVWTDRGVHFYFNKPKDFRRGANRISPLGFAYEIKHKSNTRAVTIKRNGVMRQIDNEGVRQEVPYIFKSAKKFDVLIGMGEGEGRNGALFKLRGMLAGVDEWKDIINFVNEHVFSEPLPIEEMVTLTREMQMQATAGGEYEVAKWIMGEIDFLQHGQTYYFKYDGDYTKDTSLLRKLVYERVGDQQSRYVDEVIKQMEYRCRKLPIDTVFDIKLANGYLRDGEFVDLETVDFTPYHIDVEYNPDCKPVEVVDNYIDHLTKSDPDYRRLLLEVLGHTLIVNPEFKRLLAKFFIFVGDGGNGKGTLLQIISKILGAKNISAMGIKELSDDRYLAGFKGKLVNLGDDIQDQPIDDKDMKALKNITTCDTVEMRELYKQSETATITGSLIFTSNHVLKSFEKGKSYKRRVLWLPMYTEVKKKDPLFITKLTSKESVQYWIKLIVEGYMRLYEQYGFSESEIVNKYNEDYHQDNNPYLLYLDDRTADDFVGLPVADVSKDAEMWCEDNDIKFNKRMFYETLREVMKIDNKGVKRDRGGVLKVFRVIE